eukprot:3684843-Prymnesium_polylepis.2
MSANFDYTSIQLLHVNSETETESYKSWTGGHTTRRTHDLSKPHDIHKPKSSRSHRDKAHTPDPRNTLLIDVAYKRDQCSIAHQHSVTCSASCAWVSAQLVRPFDDISQPASACE